MEPKKIQQYKKDSVAELKQLLEGRSNYVFVNYRGLTVKQVTDLRNNLRKEGCSFQVIKNNYMKIALEQSEKPFEEDSLVGPTAVAVMNDDASGAVKALVNFQIEPPLTLKGGVIDGDVYDKDRLVEFSKLPGKNELLSMLLGTLNAPAQQTAGVLSASIRQLLYALNAVKEKQDS